MGEVVALDLEQHGCINPHPNPPPSWGREYGESRHFKQPLHRLPSPKMGKVRKGVDAAVIFPN
jgi:hypothetical protein